MGTSGTPTVDRQLLVSYHRLQQTVGWIAFVMPLAVRTIAKLRYGISWSDSISAYYYTAMRDEFVGSLVVGGLALSFFRTDSPRDRWIAVVAGIAAAGIGLFPMDIRVGVLQWASSPDGSDVQKIVDALSNGPHGPIGFHMYFVATFFALTFYLVAFRFSANTPQQPTRQKTARNLIYKICGALMALGMVWIAYIKLTGSADSIFPPEMIAVMSFAAAWLVKGQTVPGLKDHREQGGEVLEATPRMAG
jgi:hypothetical protein